MRQIPYGYRIENGAAVIDEPAAERIRSLYKNYLSGMALANAAKEAGIEVTHSMVKRMLANTHYLGDDFYPALVDEETYNAAQEELLKRATELGRLDRDKKKKPVRAQTLFRIGEIKEQYDNPATQAEYLYSLIECEVS